MNGMIRNVDERTMRSGSKASGCAPGRSPDLDRGRSRELPARPKQGWSQVGPV